MKIIYKINDQIKTSSSEENEDFYLKISECDNRKSIAIATKRQIKLISAEIEIPYQFKKSDLIYVNGYQSWTDTREFHLDENLKSLKRVPKFLLDKFKFAGYGDYHIVDYQKNVLHGFMYGYIKSDKTTLIGSYNRDNAFLIIKFDTKNNVIRLSSDVENLIVDNEFVLFDYTFLQGEFDKVIDDYFSVMKCPLKSKLKGYTSWYNHYQDISEEKILNALKGIDQKQYNLFQIDDGYETFVGDWFDIDKKKFPHGLDKIVKDIKGKGLIAGIWLAPFVVETNSSIYQNHKEYLYLEDEKEVYAGGNWSKHVVLDIRKYEVKEYIKKCLEYYIDLGFDFFKLDFLYAVGLIKDPFKTRCMLMKESMDFLRSVLKDKLILGCGVSNSYK